VLVNGDEELVAFRIENGGDVLDTRCSMLDSKVDDIGGDYVQCIDRNDFCGVCEVHYFCRGYCNAQTGEAAGADRDIDVLDLFGLSGYVFEQSRNSGEYFRTVSHWAGENGFGEYLLSKCNRHGACSAGSFNG